MSQRRRELSGLRVTVMGLGQFGGGAGVVRYLLDRGACVTVTDRRSPEQLGDVVRQFENDESLRLHLGEHRDADFIETDLVIVSPAVTPGNPFVELADNHGIPLTSEIGLFWERCPARIVGVTGTNGKSTTASLLYDCLKNDGRRVWLGGNIGGSLLGDVDSMTPDDWVVLELSSFQLSALNEMKVSPHVAVVTNFSPNHLDWHPGLDHYRHAKQAILRWQRADDIAVLGGWDEVRAWPVSGTQAIVDDSFECFDPPPSLHGLHHAQNIATVVAAARAMGVGEPAIRQAIAEYQGLPHRMQFIGAFQGRQVYNDSASTTPESTLAALTSLDGSRVVLVGGADKGVDLTNLAAGLRQHANVVVLMGAVAPRLEELMKAPLPRDSTCPCEIVTSTSIDDAVLKAFFLASPGDIISLSPGSWRHGWFTNFVERGNEFVRLVHEVSGCSETNCN